MSMTALASAGQQSNRPELLPIGEAVFVQTVTHYWLGRIETVWEEKGATVFSLTEASWVSETERFSEFIKTGEARSCEPVVIPVRIALHGVLTMILPWPHKLPRIAK